MGFANVWVADRRANAPPLMQQEYAGTVPELAMKRNLRILVPLFFPFCGPAAPLGAVRALAQSTLGGRDGRYKGHILHRRVRLPGVVGF